MLKFLLSSGVSQVATPELGAVLASNSLVLRKVQIDISSFISDGANANSQLRIPRTALKEPLPGWKNLCDALSEAAAVVSVVASPLVRH